MLSSALAQAKINNAKIITVKVSGVCEMCKARIEKAANVKKQVKANWSDKTLIASITYDSVKTSSTEILKRIAYAGHDNETFIAPDEAYNKLPSCCKYKREFLPAAATMPSGQGNMSGMDMSASNGKPDNTVNDTSTKAKMDMPAMSDNNKPMDNKNADDDLQTKYNEWLASYLIIKNALTSDNADKASQGAAKFLELTGTLPMDKMPMPQHMEWMKVVEKIKADAASIKQTKDIAKQRSSFQSLSKNVSTVVKAFKLNNKTVYQQFCPMFNNAKGAYWISEQSNIKNPYYGKSMPTCGSTTETIKPKK